MAYQAFLRMNYLPKPELKLLNDFIAHYHLDPATHAGYSEMFVICLRLAYEVYHMRGTVVEDGEAYLTQLINTWRSHPYEVREYSLD
jgi:hypothetical protein